MVIGCMWMVMYLGAISALRVNLVPVLSCGKTQVHIKCEGIVAPVDALSRSHTIKWFRRFWDDRKSVKNDLHSERPVLVPTMETIAV